MLIRHILPWQARAAEVTPPAVYHARRRFLGAAAGLALGGTWLAAGGQPARAAATAAVLRAGSGRDLEAISPSPWSVPADSEVDSSTPWDAVTGYNNFYEFGTGKEDPAAHAHHLLPRPWTVAVDGAVARPGRIGIEDILAAFPLEERIYRLRCVEGWSMVIPWVGFPLAALLQRFEPLGSARYVAFETLHDPAQMPGQKGRALPWPYVEGLRLDEALHPLTILAVGLYGKELPNQNGAPLRLVVPWKYGFKSIKSIVRIELSEREPNTTWQTMAPHEYGFYANVNPAVEHPRWSQATERRIGEFRRRATLPFNGYGEAVADLYAGMDPATLY